MLNVINSTPCPERSFSQKGKGQINFPLNFQLNAQFLALIKSYQFTIYIGTTYILNISCRIFPNPQGQVNNLFWI